MTRRDCAILGLHAILVIGITAGYVCMYKKLETKKSKLCLNSLD